jgi:hypothetical protein
MIDLLNSFVCVVNSCALVYCIRSMWKQIIRLREDFNKSGIAQGFIFSAISRINKLEKRVAELEEKIPCSES